MKKALQVLACAASCSLLTSSAGAGTLISTDDAGAFFNTVAARLLRSEAGADLNRIEVYPTNNYTPEVHRLLQFSANLYECTTNNPATDYPYLPRVYRPMFTNDSGKVFLCGYVEETGTNLLARVLRDLSVAADRESLGSDDRVLGFPVIIGARKGFPNFNEVAGDTVINVARKLQFRRDGPYGRLWQTNVNYLVQITNVFGMECWNPYTNAFTRDLQIVATARVGLTITNEHGLVIATNIQALSTNMFIPANTWPGFMGSVQQEPSFLLPIFVNWTALPLSRYSQSQEKFFTDIDYFEYDPTMPVPLWYVQLRVSVNCVLIDSSAHAIVDYVSLDSTRFLDLTRVLTYETPDYPAHCDPFRYAPSGTAGSLFCTNRYMFNPWNPSIGILNQIAVGQGSVSSPLWPMNPTNTAAINFFRAQFLPYPDQQTNVFYCPFSPFRTLYLSTRIFANDPLVHHTMAQLRESPRVPFWQFAQQYSTVSGLGTANRNYRPWGFFVDNGPNTYNSALKDPSVRSADQWNFPENQKPDLSWVPRVHRGTPWQTVYWKSGAVDPNLWWSWIAAVDAGAEAFPTNDWRLAELLAPLFNTNYPHACASINNLNSTGWASLMDGLVIYTNDANHEPQPMTIRGGSPEALAVGNAIVASRQLRGGWFRNLGDVLGVRDLSDNSPWQIASWNYLTETALEGLVSQLAGKLRSEPVAWMNRNPLSVQFSVIPSFTYRIETSSNLFEWTPLSTNTPASYVLSQRLSEAPKSPQFFRTLLLNAR